MQKKVKFIIPIALFIGVIGYLLFKFIVFLALAANTSTVLDGEIEKINEYYFEGKIKNVEKYDGDYEVCLIIRIDSINVYRTDTINTFYSGVYDSEKKILVFPVLIESPTHNIRDHRKLFNNKPIKGGTKNKKITVYSIDNKLYNSIEIIPNPILTYQINSRLKKIIDEYKLDVKKI